MIINFSIENWRSFKERRTLSMVPTSERQHLHRIPRLQQDGIKILPIASIYGGNASGKSNLVAALLNLRSIIVERSDLEALVPVDPFWLDEDYRNKPSNFEMEFLIDSEIYRYTLSATRQKIVYEKLVKIDGKKEITQYERNESKIENMMCNGDLKDRLKFIANNKMTRSNQTFLASAVELNFEPFFPIWRWFRDNLVILFPSSKYVSTENFVNENNQVAMVLNEMLQELDTGISHIGGEDVDISKMNFSPEQNESINRLPEGRSLKFNSSYEIYIVTKKNGQASAKRLTSYHKKLDGTNVPFGLYMESDGSKRVIDIAPAIISLLSSNSTKIFIIDEIDRSLHTFLTQALIKKYFQGCSNDTRSQMIITTHDVQLINQDIFRRDEIWFTERKSDGNSDLFSLGSFEGVRYDKDIRKSYLQGRFGGIQNITSSL
jgi:AAA15 family ATPase/GTPase